MAGPFAGRHALQIEINRALYLDEKTYQPTAGFNPLRRAMAVFAERLADLPASWFGTQQAAE